MLKKEEIFFPNSNRKEKLHVLHPSPCTLILWEVFDLAHDTFFPIPKKFWHYKMYQAYRAFYFSCAPSPPRKNIHYGVVYATTEASMIQPIHTHDTLKSQPFQNTTFGLWLSWRISEILNNWLNFFSKVNISRKIIITVIIFSR